MKQTTATKAFGVLIIIAGFALASSALASFVLSRTQHAANGYPSSVAGVNCWDNSGAFMTNLCTTTQGWLMPLVLDTGGNKTFALVGQVLSGGTASCSLVVYTPSGSLQASTAFPTLPSASVGSSLLNAAVPQGDFGMISCSASGSGKVKLLGVQYTP